jgi:hypothetical protein
LHRGSTRRKTTTYTQNKRTQASMPGVGLEPTIPVFERAKTVHALDRAATVIGLCKTMGHINSEWEDIYRNNHAGRHLLILCFKTVVESFNCRNSFVTQTRNVGNKMHFIRTYNRTYHEFSRWYRIIKYLRTSYLLVSCKQQGQHGARGKVRGAVTVPSRNVGLAVPYDVGSPVCRWCNCVHASSVHGVRVLAFARKSELPRISSSYLFTEYLLTSNAL